MRFRLQHICWFALFGAVISATTSLIDMIQANPELSTLYGYVNASSKLTSLISSAGNFKFLAPSNNAIATFTKANPNILTGDLLLATIQYSFLEGVSPSLSFAKTSQFVATTFFNTSFTNVTAGQTVELNLSSGGSPQVLTGNKSMSTSTSTVGQSTVWERPC